MDAQEIVKNDINTFIRKSLMKGVLVNPRIPGDFANNRSIITSKYSFFTDEEDYIENYYKKYENGEYFVAFPDGAFIQLNYEFRVSGKRSSYLEKMNLCYLPSVNNGKKNNEYIRVDYSNSEDNNFFHPYAHLHIGFNNTIRIPLNEVLLFSEFIKLILYLFYPDDFIKLFDDVKTTNTIDKSDYGKLSKDKVLTNELKSFLFLDVK